MVRIRYTQILMAAGGKPESSAELSTSLQIVSKGRVRWAKKMFWLRNAPYTVGPYAHDGQIEWRLKFAEAAHQAKGEKGLKDGLPPAAYHVREKLTGKKASKRMSPEEYPSKIRRTAYTAEDLKAIAKKRGITV